MNNSLEKNEIKIKKSKKKWKILIVVFLIGSAIAAIGGGSYMIVEAQKTPDKSIIN